MKYKHIPQKDYCCVPASISMILKRRGINPPTQEEIAYDLGVILPPEHRHLLSKSYKGKRPMAGYGTRIDLKQYSLASFFKKRNYPLEEKFYPATHFKTAVQFRSFLKRNLDNQNDQLVCFNQGFLKKSKKSWGHCTVIANVSKKVVFMADSEKKTGLRRVLITNLLKATKKHYKGGVWVITSTVE